MAALTSKAEILAAAASDRPAHKRPVKEWGSDVYIRALSGHERDEVESWHIDNPRGVGIRAFVVAKGLCDEGGQSLGLDESEVNQLGKGNGGAIDFLYWEIMKLSKYSEKEIKELEGNSSAGPSDSSGCV